MSQRYQRSARPALGALLASLLTAAAPPARAQGFDPTTIGAGQRPFVVVLVDSSASMEFGAEGEQEPICHARAPLSDGSLSCDASAGLASAAPPGNASNAPSNSGDPSIFAWSPGQGLSPPSDTDPYDRGAGFGAKDYEDADEGAYFAGPCYVWKDICADYVRPPGRPICSARAPASRTRRINTRSRCGRGCARCAAT